MQASSRRRRRQGFSLAATCALALLIAGRTTILSGFELGFGDRGDSPIEIGVLEHWRNVLMGVEAWNRPIFFHPHGVALGYNDAFLLHGIVYSFWRLFADPFLADSLNVLTFNPPGWNFADPLAADYDARVLAYARAHALHGLCRLDMRDASPWGIATRSAG